MTYFRLGFWFFVQALGISGYRVFKVLPGVCVVWHVWMDFGIFETVWAVERLKNC